MDETTKSCLEAGKLLVERAPCFFCGYNGSGFYQAGTHGAACPWHGVGGSAERAAALPRLLRGLSDGRIQNPDLGR